MNPAAARLLPLENRILVRLNRWWLPLTLVVVVLGLIWSIATWDPERERVQAMGGFGATETRGR